MEEQNRNKETALGEARRPSSVEEAEAAIEAVLFAMGDSVELGRIAKAIGHDTETTRRILNHMMEKYNTKDRGIHIVELENAYQMCTKQEYYDYLVNIAMQPKKAVLTDVMMETLSIIAYKQPVTKQEIDKIRGVKSDHAVNKLVEYNLVHNAVDGNFEKSFLSVEFVFSIVFRESDGYIYAVARVMADELFFKVIDVSVGADHKISAVSFCVSSLEFHAVNGADIVDIDGITVLNGEGSVGLQRGRSRSGG